MEIASTRSHLTFSGIHTLFASLAPGLPRGSRHDRLCPWGHSDLQVLQTHSQDVGKRWIGLLNLRLLQDLSHLDPWSTSKEKLRGSLTLAEAVEVSIRDRWRLSYLSSLLAQRREAYQLVLEAETSILDGLINSLVRN